MADRLQKPVFAYQLGDPCHKSRGNIAIKNQFFLLLFSNDKLCYVFIVFSRIERVSLL